MKLYHHAVNTIFHLIVASSLFSMQPEYFPLANTPSPNFTPQEIAQCLEESLYQDQIDTTVKAAMAVLDKISVVTPNMTVIFDVDATVLDQHAYFTFPSQLLAKSVHYYFQAIPRMRDLCWYAYNRSFKILFITGRQEKHPAPDDQVARATRINLQAEKFPPFELMCRPYETNHAPADWKKQLHAELAKQFLIVAIFDDDVEVLENVVLAAGTWLFRIPSREDFVVYPTEYGYCSKIN